MSPGSRSIEIDAVRSAALFGICIVNVPFLAQPPASLLVPPSGTDLIARMVIQCLFEGKFFILFAFVFGWGFGAQLSSAAKTGVAPQTRLLRRLAGLALIGAAHAALVFFGDILILYALLGLGLLPLRNAPPARLMRIALAALAVAALGLLALALSLGQIAEAVAAPTTGPGYAGGFWDGVRQRLSDWPTAFAFILLFNGPVSFAAFCAGLAAWKVGFFEARNPIYARLRKAWPILLGLGLALNIAYAMASSGFLGETLTAAAVFSGLAVGGPVLAAVYLIGFVELARRVRPTPETLAVGRMSLTAYVFEGILAGLVFNGYGLGLYGSLGAVACLAVAAAIYAATHLFAALWSRALGEGPLERLLRLITRGTARRPAP
jgi:uncharacterized protein